jgi:glutamate dehydrogenase
MRSTVHRPQHADVIATRILGAGGKAAGARLFLGLFAAGAYNRNPRSIPLLRTKVERILARAGVSTQQPRRPRAAQHPRHLAARRAVPGQRGGNPGRRAHRARPVHPSAAGAVFPARPLRPLRVRHRLAPAGGLRHPAARPGRRDAGARAWRAPVRLLHRAGRRAAGPHPLHHRHRPGPPRRSPTARRWRPRSCRPRAPSPIGWARPSPPSGARPRPAPPWPPGATPSRPPTASARTPGRPPPTSRWPRRPWPRAGPPPRSAVRPAPARAASSCASPCPAPPWPLADALPLFDSLDFRAIEECRYRLQPLGLPEVTLHVFQLDAGGDWQENRAGPLLEALAALLAGEAEADGFNRLVLRAGLSWRECWLLRAMYRWLKQVGLPFAQESVSAALAAQPEAARLLVRTSSTPASPQARSATRRSCSPRGRRRWTPWRTRTPTCASGRSPAAGCAGPTAARTSAPRCSAWSRRRW